jgi:hypothetical protein
MNFKKNNKANANGTTKLDLTTELKKYSDEIKPILRLLEDNTIPLSVKIELYYTKWLPLHNKMLLIER